MGTRSCICRKGWGGVGYMRVPCCYQAMSKLIIVKSLVDLSQ